MTGSDDVVKRPSPAWDVLPYQLMTSGIGCFWASAGGGRVAIVGLALVFTGDVIRLTLRLQRGPVPSLEPGGGVWPALPFLIMGIIANEGMMRLVDLSMGGALTSGLRVGAGLYALAILWAGPPGGLKDIWNRILGLQVGAAQALFLGVPVGWLLRPASMTAGRPEVGGSVAVGAGVFWFIGVVRLLRRRKFPLREVRGGLALAALGTLTLADLFLTFWRNTGSGRRIGISPGWSDTVVLGFKLGSIESLGFMAAVAFVTTATGSTWLWLRLASRRA